MGDHDNQIMFSYLPYLLPDSSTVSRTDTRGRLIEHDKRTLGPKQGTDERHPPCFSARKGVSLSGYSITRPPASPGEVW